MELHSNDERTSPNCPQSLLTRFPPELLDQIITHFIRDPYTTVGQLKSLRLVCRSFDRAVARRALSCIRLFGRGGNSISNMRQLQAIVCSDLNGHLYGTETLVMGNWRWRYGDALFVSLREIRDSDLWTSAGGIIWNSTVAPLIYLLVMVVMPHILPLSIYDSVTRLRTKRRLSRASVLNIPNVRRVVWTAETGDPNWIASSTMKLVLDFHQLSELVLFIDYEQDLNHISKCFSSLYNLRKLKIDVRRWPEKLYRVRPNPIHYFGRVIGANLNLTHLELFQTDGAGGNLAKILGYVPSNSPLKLEHLGLSDNFLDAGAIASHARSLRSIDLYEYTDPGILTILCTERIFPPIIQASCLDVHLIDYLTHHPRIVGISIHTVYEEFFGKIMLEIMARHSESLKYFSTFSQGLFDCIKWPEIKILLLQCTKLEQLTLWFDSYSGTDVDVPQDLKIVLFTIASIPSSLTLVITNLMAFKACIRYCSQPRHPLVRDIVERIVYEEPRQRGWSGWGW